MNARRGEQSQERIGCESYDADTQKLLMALNILALLSTLLGFFIGILVAIIWMDITQV